MSDLHDLTAHHRDRGGAWPTCDRCSELAIAYHDEHRLGHLVPLHARTRLTEIEQARADLKETWAQ